MEVSLDQEQVLTNVQWILLAGSARLRYRHLEPCNFQIQHFESLFFSEWRIYGSLKTSEGAHSKYALRS